MTQQVSQFLYKYTGLYFYNNLRIFLIKIIKNKQNNKSLVQQLSQMRSPFILFFSLKSAILKKLVKYWAVCYNYVRSSY